MAYYVIEDYDVYSRDRIADPLAAEEYARNRAREVSGKTVYVVKVTAAFTAVEGKEE